IRDATVTGVQTCALPIWDVRADLGAVRQAHAGDLPQSRVRLLRGHRGDARADTAPLRGSRQRRRLRLGALRLTPLADQLIDGRQIGRASCRERVWVAGWR